MATLYPQPINDCFIIKAAQTSGYTVSKHPTREMREDCLSPSTLFAGTLDDCLAFIKQEIIKHDEWRDEGPTPSKSIVRNAGPVRRS